VRRRSSVLALVALAVGFLAPTIGALPAEARGPTVHPVVHMRSMTDIWCAPDGTCLGVGQTQWYVDPSGAVGAVVVLEAGGPVGPIRTVPGTVRLSGITCRAEGGCVAVGQGGGSGVVVDVSRDGTPGAVRAVPGSLELHRVACPTTTTCLATGSLLPEDPFFPWPDRSPVFTVITNGQPTPARPMAIGSRRATGIACPTATTCLTAGRAEIGVLIDLGGTWVAQTARRYFAFDGGAPSEGIDCPTTSCTATAFSPRPNYSADYYIAVPAIMAVRPDGIAGPAQVLIRNEGDLTDISCLGSRTCTVVGKDARSGLGMTIDVIRGWTAGVTLWPETYDGLTGVDCVGLATCGIVGNTPGYAVFAWHGPIPG
jgi:hypothetical protein